jgi:hypothetical protein
MPTLAKLAANLALCDASLSVHEALGSSALWEQVEGYVISIKRGASLSSV